MKMEEKKRYKQILPLVAAVTAVVCLVTMLFYRTEVFAGGLHRLIGILEPFIYGAVIAYILRPVSLRIEKVLMALLSKITKKKWKGAVRMASILLSLALMLVVLYLLVMAVLPQMISSLSGLLSQLPDAFERFQDWLSAHDEGEMSHEVVTALQSAVSTLSDRLQQFLQSDLLPNMQSLIENVTSSFRDLLNLFKNFGLGCIISAYFLGAWEKFVVQARMVVYAVFPKRGADWIRREVRYTDEMFSGFIYGKLVDSLLMGVICFVGMSLLRMPYAMLISVIVGVTNIIPFFGPYIGAIPSALLMLTVSVSSCVIFLVFLVILQQFDGNIMGPMIIGDRLGISGFWILFSILFFGSLWGLVGMLTGVPVFAVLYDLIRRFVMGQLEKKGEREQIQAYREHFRD